MLNTPRPQLQIRTQGRRKALCIALEYHMLVEKYPEYSKLKLTDSTYADVARVQNLLVGKVHTSLACVYD